MTSVLSKGADISGYHKRIDRIEASINNIHGPLAFFDEVYKLKEHVDLVRGELDRMSKPVLG